MRILVISNLYPPHYVGGYELICQRVTNALRARGHVLRVLTSNHTVAGASRAGEAEEQNVERALGLHGALGHPWLPLWRLRDLERHNNDILRAALGRFEPDLVYCWNLSGLSKSMLFTLQRRRVRTAFCICDHWVARSRESDVWLRWWNQKQARPLHRMVRALCGWSGARRHWDRRAPTQAAEELEFSRIHFCSAFLREFTAKAGMAVSHGAVIYCPVNIEQFSGQAKPEAVSFRRLLYAGRLHADKGVMTALRAMARLRTTFEGELSIIGGGEGGYEKELKDFAQRERLPVRFCKVGSPEQMPAVYRAHDALLFTSEWPEPFALTPLEAMATGLPVIGTMTGGSAELFRHGENSLTYEAGRDEELAGRILELAENASLRTKLARAGQKEVRSRYAEPIIVDQIESHLAGSI